MASVTIYLRLVYAAFCRATGRLYLNYDSLFALQTLEQGNLAKVHLLVFAGAIYPNLLASQIEF